MCGGISIGVRNNRNRFYNVVAPIFSIEFHHKVHELLTSNRPPYLRFDDISHYDVDFWLKITQLPSFVGQAEVFAM